MKLNNLAYRMLINSRQPINRTLLSAMMILIFTCVKAQVITGKVYRAGTDSVIAGASIYYGGTTATTLTDKQGNFTIKAKAQQIPVNVSCIGYNSGQGNYTPGKSLIIYLQPKTEELHTVTIRADGMNRKSEIELFKKEFLGTSVYAKSCVITNMDDINFFYNKKTSTLTANCDNPIIIQNKMLGYTITYYLDHFIKTRTSVNYAGNPTFKDIAVAENLAKVNRNRENAYKGSRMQFIRALWHHSLKKAGFNIYMVNYDPLTEDSLVKSDVLHQKYIFRKYKVLINHSDNRSLSNYLIPDNEYTFIDKDGYAGKGLNWWGDLGSQRIGDLLPREYQAPGETLIDMGTSPLRGDTLKLNPAAVVVAYAIVETPPERKQVFEKAYLHTDRDIYMQGDTLWYKAYLLNAQNHQPGTISGNMCVELISKDSARVRSSQIIRVTLGVGNGDIVLTDAIHPGAYSLRAYTNWMRNFSDNFIFQKDITIIGTVKANPALAVNKKAVPIKSVKPAPKSLPVVTASVKPLQVRFYPEGGSLVDGLASIIAVKAEDNFGKGVAITGAIYSPIGDTVGHFTCDSLGMGLFTLLPVKGQRYSAVVNYRGKQTNFDLPQALSKGVTMQLRQTGTIIYAGISVSDEILANSPSAKYTLRVRNGGVNVRSLALQAAKQASVSISTASLPEGINAITLYDEQNRPNCERLVYIHHPGASPVAVNTNKKNYLSKEQVTVQIKSAPNSQLSMAVVDAGVIPEQADDMVSYLRLGSELKGTIEQSKRYFDTTNVNRFKQLDLLLMTQGWRDFVWRRIIDTTIKVSYEAEDGIAVSGVVKNDLTSKLLPGLNMSLYAPTAKGQKIFTEKSDSLGRFTFPGLMLYGDAYATVTAINSKGAKNGFIIPDTIAKLPYKPALLSYAANHTSADSVNKIKMEKWAANVAASKTRGVTHLKQVNITTRSSIVLKNASVLTTWGPDQVFNITPADDQYKTLEWYLLQHSKGAQSSTVPDTSGIVYAGLDTCKCNGYSGPKMRLLPPAIFVNGRELYMDENTQAEAYRIFYYKLPIKKFKKVVLRHMVGTLHGPPPIYINNPEPTIADYQLNPKVERMTVDRYLLYLTIDEDAMYNNPGMANLEIPGYYQARTFYKPVYTNPASALPDLRSTIHWEPNIKTDANGLATVTYYNADPKTNIRIVVQGITEKGMPISSTFGYEVK